MTQYYFYYFCREGSPVDSSVVVRAGSPQEACKIYFSNFPRPRSGSSIALFVSNSLNFDKVDFLKVIR